MLFGDFNSLEQVFMNLISNSADALCDVTGRKRIINVNISQSMATYLNIIIEDNATGINKDVLDKIFEPFFTTKEKGKGTGLGLSIIKNIVIEHSGEISVDSEVGKGTRFLLKLPTVNHPIAVERINI